MVLQYHPYYLYTNTYKSTYIHLYRVFMCDTHTHAHAHTHLHLHYYWPPKCVFSCVTPCHV